MSWRSQTRRVAPFALATCAVLRPVASVTAQSAPPCVPAGIASLVLTVHDRVTRVPLVGATVAVSWTADGDNTVRASTDSIGRVLLCAPPDQRLSVYVTYRDVSEGPLMTTLTADRPTAHTFLIETPAALVRGIVLDEVSGAPVADAVLSLVNTPLRALTTTDGRFQFPHIPMGDYVVRIEHLTYATVRALAVRGNDLETTIRIGPSAVPLEPLLVTAFSRRLDHVGFYDREKRGIGIFINRQDIEAMHAQTSSDLLRNVPGVRLVPQWPRRDASRNDLQGRGRCRFSFIVDGARTLPDFQIDFIAPHAIEGIEVYRGLAEVPAPLRAQASGAPAGSMCGVIAIWTRNSR